MQQSAMRMQRIDLIDSLRGFALFLILIFHAYNSFGIGPTTSPTAISFNLPDSFVNQFMHFFVIGKAFAIFSIMFGFSFFIQSERSSFKQDNFSLIFARRLFLLFIIGYIHALFYRGDILTKYALTGFILLLLPRLSSRTLILLAILFLLQIPSLISIIQSVNLPSQNIESFDNPVPWERMKTAYTQGSFGDVVRVNMWTAFKEIWRANILSGRMLMIIGYFIIGLLLGRSRIFENIENNLVRLKYTVLFSGIFYVVLRIIRTGFPGVSNYSEHSVELISALIGDYMDISIAIILIAAFILIYQNSFFKKIMNLLVPYGRMGLSSYIMGGILGVLFFYGFGLALFKYSSPFTSVIVGVVIFMLQLIFAHHWFRFYSYGPIEWIWRSLTFPGRKIPLKKVRSASLTGG